jgi:PAS domain S-box-containing protein
LSLSLKFDADGVRDLQILWEDSERALCRGRRRDAGVGLVSVLIELPVAEHPAPQALDRLAHEYGLKDELDAAWAARALDLVREGGRTALLLEDHGGEPLERLLGEPMETGQFLRLSINIAASLGRAHRRGLVHKDVKPANILVNCADGRARLIGFGVASRLPRQRQAPEPPEIIAGTLAYMAPEQTGRINRSIDSRSDLYALGVTFYRMLTGRLPFTAADPMEWVHCHIARKPTPPGERSPAIPAPISDIVLKLLAKPSEERYQTAAGLEHDLRICLEQWEAHGRVEAFSLGECDMPDRLVIPEKLYGREREVEALLAAFDRVVGGGQPELLLVSGYSGIGKSSVVNELHKALVPPRGLFASGKFDQYKRDIPYSTLVQAFQKLMRPLLGKSDAELARWRDAFLEALEPFARLMTDLVPELKLIIGDQPPIPELEPRQAQSRFQLVFGRFVGVFARREHPLALFLDDLQWLDGATLDFLEYLLTRSDLHHLMVVGAFRDNEADAAHPLTRKLDALRQVGARVQEIRLAPLARDGLGQLIADALRCDTSHAKILTHLVHKKTAGNPFFAIQFLHALAEENLLRFDHDAACWSWDIEGIHTKGYTDNVADLMVGRLARLPPDTQQALQQLACLGNIASIGTLSIVLGGPEEQVHASLWPAIHQELVERLEGSYKFIHDRVQEAANSLIPEASRAVAHLHIGRLLQAHTLPEQREEAIFDIVNQFNRGAALIARQEERDELAGLNLIAGKRAKGSAAYASALAYLDAGAALLAEDRWERRRELAFALELNRAECEFLTARALVADERLVALANWAATTIEKAMVASLHMDVCTALDQSGRGVAVCLDYLRHVDIEWSPNPKDDVVRREYKRIWSLLGNRTIEDLIDLPLMEDPVSLATIDVLHKLVTPAWFTDANLLCLTVCKAVSLSLERGNCDASCAVYVLFGTIAGSHFGDHKAGFRFGQLGYDLVERRGLKRFEARTYLNFAAFIVRWAKHGRASRDLLRRAFETANRSGDPLRGSTICHNLNGDLLFTGDPLPEAQAEAEHGLAFATKAQFGLVTNTITTQLMFIRTLRGLTLTFGCFDDDQFDEREFKRHLTKNTGLALPECCYWIRKMQARYMCGDYTMAVDAASKAQPLAWTTWRLLEEAEYHFFGALSRTACFDTISADERWRHVDAIAAHHRKLKEWAEYCPENFENRAALVGAEIARIEGRVLDAEHLYEQAIRSARANGFVHNEALANEVAARFFAARGFEKIALTYLRDARYCYLRWGADGKVRQLDELYPHLRDEERAPAPTSTMGAPVEHLDLATVIKVSQAVSGEIVVEKLLDTLMHTAIEHAGAQRGLLIVPRGAEQQIAAEATISGDSVVVRLRDEPVTADTLPESILHYVVRTREPVLLDDAWAENQFTAATYFLQHEQRSILCLPLLNQSKLIGVLYLENNLAPHVFTPARISVLKLLASQAAIALENTRLYRDLAEREARIRRLVDANIIGIFIWELEGQIIEANDTFLSMVGYDREDLDCGRVRWTDLTPPEWREPSARAVLEVTTTGTLRPYEREYFRKDGSRVPVLIGAAALDEQRDQGVAFVLDLTERKRAEQTLREVQMELAHANRVATMGQLSASIAHEVKQPIAATVTNAQAGQRWLDRQPPDLEKVRQSLDYIVRDGKRASDVIDRIRALVKKAPSRNDRLDINEAIREVIALSEGEATKTGVAVRTDLAAGLPLIEGDRVQLQQVVLNLIINAIQAMSAVSEGGRELLIGTGADVSGSILVAVQDTGPGLDPSSADRLFKAFYTTKPGGMGMGLAICRSIIEAHGGRLWASANEPRGAVFQFILRAERDETVPTDDAGQMSDVTGTGSEPGPSSATASGSAATAYPVDGR